MTTYQPTESGWYWGVIGGQLHNALVLLAGHEGPRAYAGRSWVRMEDVAWVDLPVEFQAEINNAQQGFQAEAMRPVVQAIVDGDLAEARRQLGVVEAEIAAFGERMATGVNGRLD